MLSFSLIKISITLSVPTCAIAWGIYALSEPSVIEGIGWPIFSISFGAAFGSFPLALSVSKKSEHGVQQYPAPIIWFLWIVFLVAFLTCAVSLIVAL